MAVGVSQWLGFGASCWTPHLRLDDQREELVDGAPREVTAVDTADEHLHEGGRGEGGGVSGERAGLTLAKGGVCRLTDLPPTIRTLPLRSRM